MTDEQLDALERAAKLATPGPWITKTEKLGQFLETEIRIATGGTLFRSTSYGKQSQDGAFIALANPAIIFSLIEELRALRKERDELKWRLEGLEK